MNDFCRFRGLPSGRGAARTIIWHAMAVYTLFLQPGHECRAQSPAESQSVESSMTESPIFETAPSEPSREEWRERVQAARQKAREIALERRNHPELYFVPEQDQERVATDRVLSDQSLQPGDIVSTKKGLFIFRGHPDQPRKNEDFIQVPPR